MFSYKCWALLNPPLCKCVANANKVYKAIVNDQRPRQKYVPIVEPLMPLLEERRMPHLERIDGKLLEGQTSALSVAAKAIGAPVDGGHHSPPIPSKTPCVGPPAKAGPYPWASMYSNMSVAETVEAWEQRLQRVG